MSVVQYRLFCDFEGHPIKRNRFKYFNVACCSPMSIKWKELLRKSICNNPKEYASFVKSLQKPKEIKGHVELNYVFDERDKSNVISCINKIREKLPSKFTFLDLQNIAEDNQFVINMNNFTDDTSDAPTYIRIFLFINLEIVLEREFNLMSWISRFMEKLYLVEPHHKKKRE